MYQPTPLKFNPDQVAELRRLALSLNPQPGPGGSGMTDYESTLFAFYQPLKNYWNQPWSNCRVVGVWPSQQIPLHADEPIRGTRHHIPLQLNAGCWVYTSLPVSTWQHLEEGQDYVLDPTMPHGAVNWGTEVRLHLLIDVEG